MQTVSTLKAAFEDYLLTSGQSGTPKSLYDPIRYAMAQPGKRFRPVLLLMSYTLYRDDFQRAFPAALALEYFHNFTLIHDDIMDEAVVRRGAKSVHAKFGTSAAILSGDLMLIRSYEFLASACTRETLERAMGTFGDTAVQICEGQQLDMDYEKLEVVNVGNYLEMIEKKTAVLLGCALQLGALLAGASDEQGHVLNEAGIQLGKAFQIQDDILDLYGEQERVGKRRGGDVIQKKKTILYALAWEASGTSARQRLVELYNQDAANPEVKIQKVMAIFDALRIREEGEQLGSACFQRAISLLDQLSLRGVNTAPLQDLAKGIFNRDY